MLFTRQEGETDEALIFRVCSHKEQIGTWDQVAKILNDLIGCEFGESTYRKRFQKATVGLNAAIQFEKERKKLQAEKFEYNKWLREESRDELITEKIVNAINSLEPLGNPPVRSISPCENKSFLLTFADCHYGVEYEIKDLYGQVVNSYSPAIFEERMELLLAKTIELVKKEGITELNVWELGDGIDGILRLSSQLMKLKYGIIDSTIRYAEYLAEWLNRLSFYTKIKFQMVLDSNHCQLRICSAPKNAFPEENMSKIMWTFIKTRLRDNQNIIFIENPTGYNYMIANTKVVLGVHGEMKNMKQAISSLSRLYQVPIDYLIGAHMHHSRSEEIGVNSEVINIRSIMGTDPYAVSLGVSASPGASLLCFNLTDGLYCEYKIKL